jgi:ABC-type nickel/cobalt efflux system permease component RcnA
MSVTLRLGLATVIAGAAVLLGSGAAEAHPLGNFTINLYAGLTAGARGIDVDYVVDMAEIPTFEERRTIDGNRDGQVDTTESSAYASEQCVRLADGLAITVGGAAVPRSPRTAGVLAFPPGAGGLSTMRLECPMQANVRLREGDRVAFHDGNYAGRIGWHEVTAVGDRLALDRSDAPTTSISSRLTSYPADLLQSPLDRRDASFTIGAPSSAPAVVAPIGAEAITRGFGDRLTTAFAGLVTRGGTSPLLGVLALATAFAIGGIHALGPGHGKTLMAAYLVGSDARPRQVVAVGAAVSVMHTASVIVLGLAVLVAGQAFTPEVAYRWTTIASGALVAGLGAYLLRARIRALAHGHHHHDHEHGHEHGHSHERPAGRFGLATLAVSGGILPSPSALIALLAAIAIGRLVFGLALVLAFGVGLATVLVAVGFGTIRARRSIAQRFSKRIATWAPVASAAGVFLVGLVLVARAV